MKDCEDHQETFLNSFYSLLERLLFEHLQSSSLLNEVTSKFSHQSTMTAVMPEPTRHSRLPTALVSD